MVDLNDYEVVQVMDGATWNVNAFGIFLVKKNWFNNPEVKNALFEELTGDDDLATIVATLRHHAKTGDHVIELPVDHEYSET